jgi:acetyl esterase/lipase
MTPNRSGRPDWGTVFAVAAVVLSVLAGQAGGEPGSESLRGTVYLPVGEGPFPAVLVIHGGSWRAGTRSQLAVYCRALMDRGMVAVAIDYRLAPKHQSPAQLEDCKAAIRWMRENSAELKIDPEQIGALGYSAGGHLAVLAALTDGSRRFDDSDAPGDAVSTRLQAVVAGGAPHDFRSIPADSHMLTYWLGSTRRENPDAYEMASSITYVSANAPPMLLFHGERDLVISRTHMDQLAKELRRVKVPVETYLVPDQGHLAAMRDERSVARSVNFLAKVLNAPDQPKAADQPNAPHQPKAPDEPRSPDEPKSPDSPRSSDQSEPATVASEPQKPQQPRAD